MRTHVVFHSRWPETWRLATPVPEGQRCGSRCARYPFAARRVRRLVLEVNDHFEPIDNKFLGQFVEQHGELIQQRITGSEQQRRYTEEGWNAGHRHGS